jgi:hypothetical protein
MRSHAAKHTHMLNFEYEDDMKMKNKYLMAISRTLSTETISRGPHGNLMRLSY